MYQIEFILLKVGQNASPDFHIFQIADMHYLCNLLARNLGEISDLPDQGHCKHHDQSNHNRVKQLGPHLVSFFMFALLL